MSIPQSIAEITYGSLTPHRHYNQATQKLVAEFNYIRTNAVAPLSTFMDYITFVYNDPVEADFIAYRSGISTATPT